MHQIPKVSLKDTVRWQEHKRLRQMLKADRAVHNMSKEANMQLPDTGLSKDRHALHAEGCV